MAIRIKVAVVLALVALVVAWRTRDNWRAREPRGVYASRSTALTRAIDALHRVAPPARGSVTGTVRDEHGAPIASARVCASIASASLPVEVTRLPTCVATDARGAYAIADAPAAQYRVSAMASRRGIAAYMPRPFETWFDLAAGERRAGADIVLRAGFEVAGTIFDAGGGVIAGAAVEVSAFLPGDAIATMLVATDARGRYVAWAAARSVVVQASADGYVPEHDSGEAPVAIDLTLRPASALAGTVVDEAGAPVADATVSVAVDDAIGRVSVHSDADGRFALAPLRPGRYAVEARTAHALGRAARSTRLGIGEHVDDVVVRVAPAHQVTGRVVIAPSQAPCPSAVVSLADEAQGIELVMQEDADLLLHADGVRPGTYRVELRCDGYIARGARAPIVVVDRDVSARWEVGEGAALRGRVVDRDGAPVEGAVLVLRGVETAPRGASDVKVAYARTDGAYDVRGLAPGRYRIAVGRDALASQFGAPERPDVEIDIALEVLQRDFVLPVRGGRIEGKVALASGAPAGKVRVEVEGNGATRSMQVDAAGQFAVDDVAPGAYAVRVADGATPSGTQQAIVRAGEVATVALVTMVAPGVLRGRVVDERGAPVNDVFVAIGLEVGDEPALHNVRAADQSVLIGADGRFVARELADGRYTVRAFRKGGAEVIAPHVALGSDVTLTLPVAGAIAGTVRCAGGLRGELRLALYERGSNERVRDESLLHSTGAFAIDEVPAGHYQLVVGVPGAQQTVAVDVEAGRTVAVDVELAGLVTVIGRAIDVHTQRPIAGASMIAKATAIDQYVALPADLRSVSETDGRFAIPWVPRGEIELAGSARGVLDGDLSPVSLVHAIPARGPDVIDVGDVPVIAFPAGKPRGDAGVVVDGNRVTEVIADGAAARAGLVAGDVITSIAGVDVAGRNRVATGWLLRGVAGASVQVTVERGATVTLTLQE